MQAYNRQIVDQIKPRKSAQAKATSNTLLNKKVKVVVTEGENTDSNMKKQGFKNLKYFGSRHEGQLTKQLWVDEELAELLEPYINQQKKPRREDSCDIASIVFKSQEQQISGPMNTSFTNLILPETQDSQQENRSISDELAQR